MVHSDILFFVNIINITLKVLTSIRIVLSTESLNGKNRLSVGHPIFYQCFRL